MDAEERKRKNKKQLIIIGIVIATMVVGWLLLAVFVGTPMAEKARAEEAAQNAKDSVERVERLAQEEAAKVEHERRMNTDKGYRDSVNAAIRAEKKASELAAREEAMNGIGVSHAEIKTDLEAFKWEYTSSGIGFAQGGVTVAVNGPSSNATLVAVYVEVNAELARAQSATMALILKNAVGTPAAAKIMSDVGLMMQGKQSGTEKSWTVGKNKVDFAFNAEKANLILQIKPQ